MTSTARCLLVAGGWQHPADASVPSILTALGPHAIQTHVEEDVERACSALKGYDLLTMCALRWRMSDPRYDAQRARWGLALSHSARDAIIEFLHNGGALLAMHTAAICFDDWPQWGDIVGAHWVWGESGHPAYGRVQVRFAPQVSGSIALDLQDFECEDEVYQRMSIAPDVEPLAFARSMQGDAPDSHNWAPVLWTRHWQGARVAYSALGHDAASLDHPVHQRLLGRAACWALGRPPYGDTASAAPQPPRSAFHA